MKNTIRLIGFGMVAGAVALTLSLASCEKESMRTVPSSQEEVTTNQTKESNSTGTQKNQFGGTITLGESCAQITCMEYYPNYLKLNKMSFTWITYLGTSYTYKFSVYKYVSNNGINQENYQLEKSFNCNQSTVTLAHSVLENNTRYLLLITNPTVTVPTSLTYNPSQQATNFANELKSYRFTTLSYKGQQGCNNGPIPQPG